jgi:hypothetical protein
VLYAGTGHLLMVRRPGNAIGLLLTLVGLLLALEMLTGQYPLYGLVTAPGSLPAARLVGWFCCSPTGGCRPAAGARCGRDSWLSWLPPW